MGKSTASCLKIITCGSDSVDHDDLQTPENKSSSDRRGWSFRKRSARHRVLSNTVNSEAPSSANKECPESTAVNFQVQPDLTVPEKTSVIQWTEEKTELSAQLDSKSSDTIAARDDNCRADATLDEPSIIIQAAIRGFLAQKVLLKQKNIIKLQAVIRGHLVRRHAVGTLRCVQAIIKMQALVRARQARLLLEGSGDFAKQSEASGKDKHDSTLLIKKEAKPNGTYAYVSIEKLLSNAFARQLMESTPRTKPINIKCDPSKSDSAWKWLERWMSVSSVSNEEPQESESAAELHEKENIGHSDGKEDSSVPSDYYTESTVLKSGLGASVETSENDDNLISYDANNLDLHARKSISPSSSQLKLQNFDQSNLKCDVTESAPIEMKESISPSSTQSKLQNIDQSNLRCDVTESAPIEMKGSISPSSSQPMLQNIDQSNLRCDVTESAPIEMKETDLTGGKVEAKPLPEKEETGNEQDIPDFEKNLAEQPETEVKKFSRKPSNPAFIAAQSKFEELTSASASANLATSPSHDPGVESSLDKVSSSTDQPFRSRDIGFADNAISNASAIQLVGSECGTELSISSTLDSPDRSEAGVNDIEQEPKISDETIHPRSRENLELGANGKSIIPETDPSYANTNKLERYESINSATGESINSMIAADSPRLEKKPEADPSDLQLELGSEASPRSHITVPDSQATPSSQVSVKPKKSGGEKSESNRKTKSSSADKKSLSNRNQDSASKSSLEQLQKEHKTGKRRNSSGSAKPDHREQEPRDSSSSNSLPSYMQATESAKAKAIANGSPRSSPDVHDKDVYIKKRHSLPGTNERQGSPRIQRSLSQAQQNAKGNGTNSPQDRKWRR